MGEVAVKFVRQMEECKSCYQGKRHASGSSTGVYNCSVCNGIGKIYRLSKIKVEAKK